MRRPLELIMRAAEITGETEAARRILALYDASFASGLKRGQKYVDPKASESDLKDAPYHDFEPLNEYITEIRRLAEPWNYTPEAMKRRRLAQMRRLSAEQDRRMREMFGRGQTWD